MWKGKPGPPFFAPVSSTMLLTVQMSEKAWRPKEQFEVSHKCLFHSKECQEIHNK